MQHTVLLHTVQQWNIWNIYNGILFNNKKEWSSYTCYNMDDPQIHAKWKKPDTKDNMLYDSIYMICPRKAKKKKIFREEVDW